MTDDLQAAAERLRQRATDEGCSSDDDYHNPTSDFEDNATVAVWALPFLDPSPISEAALREMGFEWDDFQHAYGFALDHMNTVWHRPPKGLCWFTSNSSRGGIVCLREYITTLGGLRALLLAIGGVK